MRILYGVDKGKYIVYDIAEHSLNVFSKVEFERKIKEGMKVHCTYGYNYTGGKVGLTVTPAIVTGWHLIRGTVNEIKTILSGYSVNINNASYTIKYNGKYIAVLDLSLNMDNTIELNKLDMLDSYDDAKIKVVRLLFDSLKRDSLEGFCSLSDYADWQELGAKLDISGVCKRLGLKVKETSINQLFEKVDNIQFTLKKKSFFSYLVKSNKI